MRKALCGFLLLLCACSQPQSEVVQVLDGDSVVVGWGKQQLEIRLSYIDAPESDQPFGKESADYLAAQVVGKKVRLVFKGDDYYGRKLAEVYLPDGRQVNLLMLEAGMAWWYEKYASTNVRAKRLEEEAKRERRGLWAEEAVAPWKWRHDRKHRRKKHDGQSYRSPLRG